MINIATIGWNTQVSDTKKDNVGNVYHLSILRDISSQHLSVFVVVHGSIMLNPYFARQTHLKSHQIPLNPIKSH